MGKWISLSQSYTLFLFFFVRSKDHNKYGVPPSFRPSPWTILGRQRKNFMGVRVQEDGLMHAFVLEDEREDASSEGEWVMNI